jgi:hypothetical protein
MRVPTILSDDPSGVQPAAAADPEVFESLIRRRPEDRHLLVARVRYLCRQREWREAATVLNRLNQIDSPDPLAWHYEGALASWVGDREGYRRIARAMLERYKSDADATLVRRAVLGCLLEPDGAANLGELAPLVDRFAGSPPTNSSGYSIMGAGFYEYRMGRYRAAIDRLRSLPEAMTTIPIDQVARALACVIRAMAFQKLEQPDEARRQFALAEAQAKPVDFDPYRPGVLPAQWNDWLRYHVLRREAECLVRDAASAGDAKVP